MWLWIACAVGLIAGLTRPFCARLHATGLWAGRAITPENAAALMPTGYQDALTYGWPSWAGFIGAVLPLVAGALGVIYAWWAGLAVFVGTGCVSAVVARTALAPVALERYLLILYARIGRRAADYAAKGDARRAGAGDEIATRVEGLLMIYLNSGVPAPSFGIARAAPHGDAAWLLTRHLARNDHDGK
jgi:hypothetical protein